MRIQNQGFDHIEYVLNKTAPMERQYVSMGFEVIGRRELPSRGTRSVLLAQGRVRILLTEEMSGAAVSGLPGGGPSPDESIKDESLNFLKLQDEGICVLALDVADTKEAYDLAMKRGAKSAMEPKVFESNDGRVVRAEIWTPGRVRYAFMERSQQSVSESGLFDEGLVASRFESPSPFGITRIDHLTNNVSIGEMSKWVDFYKTVFGFTVTRHFKITTGRTGLVSDVVQSPDNRIIVPINEATEPASQVQEFVNRLKGPGVQHLAFLTTDIIPTLKNLRKTGMKFLAVPSTYYEEVPTRVPGVSEDLKVLEDLGILLDGEGGGYLLQIFSEEILGPFFFEFIQRKGNNGFGEGNFKALFQAIERDQVKRGVLTQ